MTTTGAATEEARLLVEAVSLLLEREREIEATMTDRFRRAELRAAEVSTRWQDIEQRLVRIERRLAELAPTIDPRRAGAAELSQLKREVESLPLRATTPVRTARGAEPTVAQPEVESPTPAARNASVWGVLGETLEARFGAALMAVGAMLLLVVLFSQAGIG
jgi:hypothetical protein